MYKGGINMKRFKPMIDYPYHEINPDGFVRSIDRIIGQNGNHGCYFERFFPGKLLHRHLRKLPGRAPYYEVVLATDGKRRDVMVHRLVAQNYMKGYDPKKKIMFKDGNHLNVLASNLIITNINHGWRRKKKK